LVALLNFQSSNLNAKPTSKVFFFVLNKGCFQAYNFNYATKINSSSTLKFKRGLLLVPNSRFKLLRRKTPQIIAATIIIAIILYILFEVLEDILIEGGTGGPLIGTITSVIGNAKDTVSSWGYGGIFGLMILESSSLPVPSEVILPFSGYLVSIGKIDFWITILVATVASIIGSLIDYYIGLKGIQTLAKRKVLGRVLLSREQLTFASKWFNKYGALTIFLARLIPGIRTLISFPAGAAKMPLAKFLTFTIAGCLMWNTVLIYVGYYLGTNWIEVAGISHYIIIAVITSLTIIIIVYLDLRRRKRKAKTQRPTLENLG
jgi:membrane protein DedA with SNARE-associated domain